MTIQIRAFTPADAAAFQQLRLRALAEAPVAFASSYEEECDQPLANVAQRLSPAPDRCVLGAFAGDAAVGMVGLQREGMKKLAHKAFIWGVYVAPEHRRSGTGQLLLKAALQRAAAMPGMQRVNLSVSAANAAAKALYDRMGFVAFGLERGYMCLDGELHDEVHMACELPAPR